MGRRDLPFASAAVTVSCAALPQMDGECALVFARMSGKEAVGELFEYDLELRTPDERNTVSGPAADLDTKALRGQELTVSIALDAADGATREISGIVADVQGPMPIGRFIAYRLTLRPWLWLTTLNRDYRIFQNQNVIEIIDTLFARYTFPVERRLESKRYPRREYQVQYGESDFDFFQRLTQEWGIAWHIEHGDGAHRLVLTDGNGAFRLFDCATYHTVRWAPELENADDECLLRFSQHERVVSGSWTSDDFDFSKAGANLTTQASDPVDTAHGESEVREWPGGHGQSAAGNDPWEEGALIARLRMEALRQHAHRVNGGGNVRGIVPGRIFTLADFVQRQANREYIVLDSTLHMEDAAQESGQSQSWRCEVEFTAQPSDVEFRPERRQAKPRTMGPQTATVVGPEGEEIWTDQYGRVRLQFHWDRVGKRDENSSCWVRVASPWQGDRFGAMQVPRVGQEVVVDFLDGDADRPLVTGRLPNSFTMPQWSMPAHHMLSGFVSKELHGQQSNAFVQDDTSGQVQTQLQSDHRASWLSLGFISRIIRGAGRKDKRGEGFELRTDAQGVLRAGGGMLVTTEMRPDAMAHHKDLGETAQRLDVACSQQDTFATLAREQGAQESGDQDEVARVLAIQRDEIRGTGSANAEAGNFPELATPHLVLSSPVGIETTTTQSTHFASGEHLALTSGGHTSLAIGKRLLAGISQGVRVLVQALGYRLIVVSGDIDLRALSDNLKLLAKLDVSVTGNRINILAKEELNIGGGGSATQYASGGITHTTSGKFVVHASSFSLSAAKGSSAMFPDAPKPGKGNLDLTHLYGNAAGVMSGYEVTDALGRVTQAQLDGVGFAAASGLAPGPALAVFSTDATDPWPDGSFVGGVDWPKAEDLASEARAQGSTDTAALAASLLQAFDIDAVPQELAQALGHGTAFAAAPIGISPSPTVPVTRGFV